MQRLFGILVFLLFITSAYCQLPEEWVVWSGSSDIDQAKKVIRDSAGNSYAIGNFNYVFHYGSSIITGSHDINNIYIAKLDPSGNWIWVKALTAGTNLIAAEIAVDGNGNVYIAGLFSNSLTIGNTYLSVPLTAKNIFTAKLDSSGNWLWAKQFGSGGNDTVTGMVIDPAAGICLSGSFLGVTYFNPLNLTSAGGYDMFLVGISSSGTVTWAYRAGGTGENLAKSLAIDPITRRLAVTGSTNGVSQFGTLNVNPSTVDVFVAQFIIPIQTWDWVRTGGGVANSDAGTCIRYDAQGNLLVQGNYNLNVTFGSISLSGGTSSQIFIAKLDSSGNWLWAKQAGGALDDYATGIAVDIQGNTYLHGYYNNTINFGTLSLTGTSKFGYIAKLDSSGNWLWARKIISDNTTDVQSITGNSDGSLTITGNFTGNLYMADTVIAGYSLDDVYIATVNQPQISIVMPSGGGFMPAGFMYNIFWESAWS